MHSARTRIAVSSTARWTIQCQWPLPSTAIQWASHFNTSLLMARVWLAPSFAWTKSQYTRTVSTVVSYVHITTLLSMHLRIAYVSQIAISISKKGKVFPYSLPSVGPGAHPGVQAVSPQVTWSHPPGRLAAITFRQACGYLSSRIILLGNRGTCVWAACPRLLPGSGPAEIWSIWIASERSIVKPHRTGHLA